MCNDSEAGHGLSLPLSRRSALTGIGGLAAAVGLSACSTTPKQSPVTSSAPAAGRPEALNAKLAVVLLGTQAGPHIVSERTGIASALVVNGATYIVDCGRSAATQFRRSQLTFATVKNIFITHLHADHIADYYNFIMLGGSGFPNVIDTLTPPVQVYGPGPAGGLPPAFQNAKVPTAEPSNPTPGLATLTELCNQAYAYTNNVMMRDSGGQNTADIATVHEIPLPNVGANFLNTAPRTAPFHVMSDENVRVTATLVPHGPVFPSFAFRFETEHGSVTFSGDTALTDNIVELAHGTDLLIHEAVNIQGSQLPPALTSHMVESHTPIQEVGGVAQRADAKKLVISHVSDFSNLDPAALESGALDVAQWNKWAQQGYKGEAFVGNDLQTIVVK